MQSVRTILRLLACAVPIALSAIPAWAADDEVLVARIKIDIDGFLYTWDSAGSAPRLAEGTEDGRPGTSPAALAAFIALRPGDRLPRAALEAAITNAESRMRASGLFYDEGLSLITLKEPSNSVAIYARATTGFSLRFGGGTAFAAFADLNADGAFLEYAFTAGYNRGSVEAGRGVEAASPLWWRIGARYANNLLDSITEPVRHDLSLRAAVGSASLPLAPRMDMAAFSCFGPASSYEAPYGVLVRLSGRERMTSGRLFSPYGDDGGESVSSLFDIEPIANLFFYAPFAEVAATGELRAGLGIGIRGFFATASAAAGMADGTVASRFRFDLFDEEARRVRGGYDPAELSLERFASLQLEMGAEVLRFPLGIISEVWLRPFLYTDLCAGSLLSEAVAFGRSFAAYGAGIRLFLGNPVFVTASVSYGLSADGRPRFCLDID